MLVNISYISCWIYWGLNHPSVMSQASSFRWNQHREIIVFQKAARVFHGESHGFPSIDGWTPDPQGSRWSQIQPPWWTLPTAGSGRAPISCRRDRGSPSWIHSCRGPPGSTQGSTQGVNRGNRMLPWPSFKWLQKKKEQPSLMEVFR